MAKEKILLIQLFSNGDCLFVTTIARQLKKEYPNCELTWVVSSKCKSILLNNPDIDVIEEVFIESQKMGVDVFTNTVKIGIQRVKDGLYSRIIVPQLADINLKYFDGIISTSLYRSSGLNITVDPTPVLFLTNEENENVRLFASKFQIDKYKNRILFECAPQSGQLNLTDEVILQYCKFLTKMSDTCVILSSPYPYPFSNEQIINGNQLSIRETIGLTHYCTLLLGCSSGISWGATSNAAKILPNVQMLTYNTYFFNPLSLTYKKWKRDTGQLIELIDVNFDKFCNVFEDIFNVGFATARSKHNYRVKNQYKLYRGIIHKFLKKGRFQEVFYFIKMNIKENGMSFTMLKYIFLGFFLFPVQLIYDNINPKAK